MSFTTIPANYTNQATINTLNDGVIDFTTEQDGQGLKIINNTTSGYLEISSAGAIVSPDGIATYPINFKDLSAITTNTTPQELVVVNTIAVQDATTTPPNNIQIQAGVIGVGTNFGIEYSSSTDQDFTIFCDENNTGGVVFKQQGFGASTTETEITQGTIVSRNTANSNVITINPSVPSLTITDGTNTNTITATGAGVSNTLQQVLDAGNSATGANAKIALTDSGVGGSANPQLTLNNSNATAGNTNGVPLVEYYKSGRNVVANDIIASQRFNANNYLGTKTAFGRIDCVATSSSAPTGDDGALDFYTCVNGTSSLVFRMNGADNENNSFRPLDMTGNNIKTSSGNMTIETSASSGTGDINITGKSGGTTSINATTIGITASSILTLNATGAGAYMTATIDDDITLTSTNGDINLNATNGYVKPNTDIRTQDKITNGDGTGSSLDFAGSSPDLRFTLDNTKIELHYTDSANYSAFQTIFQDNTNDEAYFKQTFLDVVASETAETIIQNDLAHHRIKLSETASGANTEITKDEIDIDDGGGNVAVLTPTNLLFNSVSIRPRHTWSTFAFSVSGTPSATILNFGSLADMTANTTWKVDVGFYTGDGVNNRAILTYVVSDTIPNFVETNSVFGYTQGGLQTPITYDPAGTPMGKYCSFTDTFVVSSSATGACSFILTGGTSDASTWSGTCRVSIVLTRLA